MRIVALLAIRNEELHLARCLEHLYQQGIETCLIDNGSTDNSMKIAASFKEKGVFRIEHLPFKGEFVFVDVLRLKEKLAQEIPSDWFIHHDADDIREAPKRYMTLLEGIKDVSAQSYNAINFDEFVFTPTDENESFEGTDYVRKMKYYYFFEPRPLHRVNAWKKTNNPVNLVKHAGHRVDFEGIKIYPDNFILRHYIILSKKQALNKYGKRKYSKYAVEVLGWHRQRATFNPDKLILPSKNEMNIISENGVWDKSAPKIKHRFFGD